MKWVSQGRCSGGWTTRDVRNWETQPGIVRAWAKLHFQGHVAGQVRDGRCLFCRAVVAQGLMEHWLETCTATEKLGAGKGSELVDLLVRPSSEVGVRQALEIPEVLKAIRVRGEAEEGARRGDQGGDNAELGTNVELEGATAGLYEG